MYILVDSIELRYIEKERKIGEKSLFSLTYGRNKHKKS